MPTRRTVVLASLVLTGSMAALPARADGKIVDVQIVDRSLGQALTAYRHRGVPYVAGQPGNRYAVQMVNRTGARVLVVLSVDGVNAVSGETAALDQAGYVLEPYSSAEVTGWRKNLAETAAFYFTSLADSYAARTDRPDNVGVIGVAVFRERAPRLEPYGYAPPWSAPGRAPSARAEIQKDGSANEGRPAASAATPFPADAAARATAPSATAGEGSPVAEAARGRAASPVDAAPASVAPRASPSSTLLSQAAAQGRSPQKAERLGTGHGELEPAPVTYTAFERASSRPAELVRVRYDSHANLVALGVIRAPEGPVEPQPFARFVPDPR